MSIVIIIASAEPIDHDSCAGRLKGGRYLQDGSAAGTYQRDEVWMRLTNAGTDHRDADEASLIRVQTEIPRAHLIYAETNSDHLLDEFVLTLPDHDSLMIINAMGLVLPIQKAKELALCDEPWMMFVEF